MRLLNSLKGKALNYTKDGRDDGQARSNIFMINNSYYLLEELGPNSIAANAAPEDVEHYRIDSSWFADKINKLMESEKTKYLEHWEILNTHLTAVGDLEYAKNSLENLVYESGKLIKLRFAGFNEDFETTYQLHKKLCVIDPRLRIELQQEVGNVFLPRYKLFYDKYTKIRFSKKHQDVYTKYIPEIVEEMLNFLYTEPEEEK
jgi:exocyst complex protein 7